MRFSDISNQITFTEARWCSGAGTHGNGVPTREILRDIFLLAIFHYRHVITFSAPETISKLDIRICKVLAH